MEQMLEFLGKRSRSGNGDRNSHVEKAKYIVVDTELTGLDEKSDSIISIGAIRMTGGRVEFSDTFSRLINTDSAFKAESVVIHGITPGDLVEEPCMDEVLSEFVKFCGDAVLVGHLIYLDIQFINREMKRLLNSELENPVIDTFSLFHWISKRRGRSGFPSSITGLYEMAKCLGVQVHDAHNAVMDSFITAQVFQRLLPMAMKEGIRTVNELVKIGDPFKGGDSFRLSREINNF